MLRPGEMIVHSATVFLHRQRAPCSALLSRREIWFSLVPGSSVSLLKPRDTFWPMWRATGLTLAFVWLSHQCPVHGQCFNGFFLSEIELLTICIWVCPELPGPHWRGSLLILILSRDLPSLPVGLRLEARPGVKCDNAHAASTVGFVIAVWSSCGRLIWKEHLPGHLQKEDWCHLYATQSPSSPAVCSQRQTLTEYCFLVSNWNNDTFVGTYPEVLRDFSWLWT